jgi:hypothetical protein
VQGCHDRIVGHIAGQLDECQAILDHFDSVCRGCIEVHCDQAEAIIQRVQAKIDNHLVYWLCYCYNLLARFGVTQPTQSELEACANGQPRPWPPATPDGQTSTEPPAEDLYLPPADDFPPLPAALPSSQPTAQLVPAVPASGQMVPSTAMPYLPSGAPTKTPAGCLSMDICPDGVAAWWIAWAWQQWQLDQGGGNRPSPYANSSPAGEPKAQFPLEVVSES